MSDTYTPTTDEVRDFLRENAACEGVGDERVEQFDRWLAAHDAEVYQRGREDAVIEMLDAAGDFHTWRELPDHVVESIIAAARGETK